MSTMTKSNTTKSNFTKALLVKLLDRSRAGERRTIHDRKQPGLIAELRPGGTLTFYLYRRINGRPTRVRIGAFPALTVEQARKQAQALVGEIAKGGDPRQARKARRAELTFGGLCQYWIEEHAKPHKRTWGEDQRLIDKFLARWKPRKLSDIKPADVQGLHNKIGEKNGKYAANRVLALVRSMFGIADQVGFLGHNPAQGVKKFREQSRERFLTRDERSPFFASLDAEPNELFRDFFRLALFTGARRGNLLTMAWANIDLKSAMWHIPVTKSGSPVTIPLPALAVEILRRRQLSVSSPWVFPGRGASGHMQEPKGAWKRICKRAGLKDFRIHDLRRTLGSWQTSTGASLPIIGKTLGHKTPQATAVYSRLDIDPVRRAMEAAVNALTNGIDNQA